MTANRSAIRSAAGLFPARVRPALPLFGAALLMLGGCAGADSYPSLARRPAERAYGQVQPVTPDATATPAPLPPPGADLVTRLAGLQASADSAHHRFLAQQPGAARAVGAATGAAVGSEAWSVAQVALASLESSRSDAMVALSDLDSLLITAAEAEADGKGNDRPAVEVARGAVTDLVAQEDATLAALRSRVTG